MEPSSLHKFSMDMSTPASRVLAKESGSVSNNLDGSSSPNYYFERGPLNQDDPAAGSLQFCSKFDSGNLFSVDKVISDKPRRVNDPLGTFVLRCEEDAVPVYNENRYVPKQSSEWFYFSVKNMPPGEYMFYICGISTRKSSLAKGMKPIIYSERDRDMGWHRSGSHTAYVHTKHSVFANVKEFKDDRFNEKYIYSFMLTIQYAEDTVFVAHQQPYTYALLQSTLANVKGLEYLEHSVLCESNKGRNCDLLIIKDGMQEEKEEEGNDDEEGKGKQILFLVGRSKASDCVSSWLMDGFLHFILSENAIAKDIRAKFDVYLVPMLNPDGVDLGFKIGNAQGIHLDKMWTNPSKEYVPTIYYTKKLIRHLTKSGKIALFCSLKGDSSRFGCYIKGVDDDPVDDIDKSTTNQSSPWDLVCTLMSRTKLMDCRLCKFERKKEMGTRCGYLQRINRILGPSLCLSFNVSVFRGSSSLYQRHLDIKDYMFHAGLFAHCIYETLDTERSTNMTEFLANTIRSRKEGGELQEEEDISLSSRDFIVGQHCSHNCLTKEDDGEDESKYIVTQRLLHDPALQLVALSLTKGSGRLYNRHMSNVISRAFALVNRLHMVEEFSHDDLSAASIADSVNGMDGDGKEKEEVSIRKGDSEFTIPSSEESSLYSFNSIYASSSDGESFAYTTETDSEKGGSEVDDEEGGADKDHKDRDKLREAQLAIGAAWGTFVDTDNMGNKFSSLHNRREDFEEIMKKNELMKKKKQSRAEEDYRVTDEFFNEVIARYLISPRGKKAKTPPAFPSPSAPTTPFSAHVTRKSGTTTSTGRSLLQSADHSRKISVSPVREDVKKVQHRFPKFEQMIHDNERRWLADHWPSNKKSKNRIGKSKKIDNQLKEVESDLQNTKIQNKDLQEIINRTTVRSTSTPPIYTKFDVDNYSAYTPSSSSRTQVEREFSINLSDSDGHNKGNDERQKDDDVGGTPSDLSEPIRMETVTSFWTNKEEDEFLSYVPETPQQAGNVSFQSPRVTSLLYRLRSINTKNSRQRQQPPLVDAGVPLSIVKSITQKYLQSDRRKVKDSQI